MVEQKYKNNAILIALNKYFSMPTTRIMLSKKSKIYTNGDTHFLYDPADPYLGIYPKEKQMYVCTKTCTLIFIAAIFIIPRNQKKLK